MSHLVHWDDPDSPRREAGEIAVTMTDLGGAIGTVGVGLRRWRVEPGRRSTPPHAHGAEEEIFFVLGGSGLLWQDGAVCRVRAGDCIVHRADEEAHTLRAGPDGLDVLAFGQRVYAENCYHPHTERVWAGPTVVAAEGPRDMWQLDAEAGPLPFPEPTERTANIVNVENVEAAEHGEGETRRAARDLARTAGSVRTGLRHITVVPGMLGCPPHCHGAEEEIFVVLDGEGVCLLGDEQHPVGRGHVLGRPPGTGVAHAFRAGSGGLTYLAYGTRQPNDICYYPRSNKIAWWGVGVIGRIERLDYWDGER